MLQAVLKVVTLWEQQVTTTLILPDLHVASKTDNLQQVCDVLAKDKIMDNPKILPSSDSTACE